MAITITNGYLTLAELKSHPALDIDANDNVDDTRLEGVIEGVSRWIDQDRKRRFFTTGSDETRYFTTEVSHRCVIEDLISMTTLKTDFDGDGTYETIWATTDYRLFPYNGSLNGEPYIAIEQRPYSVNTFPTYPGAVQVIGKFG